jgi:hypothetical protein
MGTVLDGDILEKNNRKKTIIKTYKRRTRNIAFLFGTKDKKN